MLGKLIKYDIIGSYREFIGIVAAIFLAAAMLIIAILMPENILTQIIPLFIFAILVAIIILSFMTIFKMFYKRIYSNEGYLTMTLPVKGIQIVSAKLIVTLMWCAIVTVTILIAGFLSSLILLGASGEKFSLVPFLPYLKTIFSTHLPYIMLFAVIISTANSILSLYLACSLSHLRMLRKFKVLAGIASFYLIGFIEGGITILAIYLFARNSFFMTETSYSINEYLQFSSFMSPMIGLAVIVTLLTSISKFFFTSYLIDKKLEME